MGQNNCFSDKYNYVYYGVTSDWFKNMLADVAVYDDVRICDDPFHSRFKLLNYIYKIHTYPYLGKFFKVPFKGIWNRYIKIDEFPENRPFCFIFTPKYTMNDNLLSYLRSKYPNCKLVVMFRDIIKNEYDWYPGFDIEEVKKKFDLVMAYNQLDCVEYGLVNFIDEAPQKIDIKRDDNYPESDLFCAIADKGRTELALKIYDRVTEAGFKPWFYIQGDGIDVGNRKNVICSKKMLPYPEYIRHLVNSKCVLEIVQEGTACFTNRAKEAIIYNKPLITNCPMIKEQRFYPSQFIQYIEKAEDIDLALFDMDDVVDYGYNDEYSAKNILGKIDDLI